MSQNASDLNITNPKRIDVRKHSCNLVDSPRPIDPTNRSHAQIHIKNITQKDTTNNSETQSYIQKTSLTMIAETNNHTTTATTTNSPLSQFAFPRTGKRGVPQQFPRRLYEMLDGETSNAASDARHPKLIVWSNSGKAFRIHNVTEFSSVVLPKYFRTHKFSSFQRNLNLVSTSTGTTITSYIYRIYLTLTLHFLFFL